MSDLERQVLAAHAAGDKGALVQLYREAGLRAPAEGARGFFLTQAYVYALETDHPLAASLRQQLRAMGREE